TGSALIYSTLIGGNSTDNINGIAVDADGNAYVTGYTASTNFPVVNPLQATLKGGEDIFVTKINSDCTAIVFSTYLGGSSGDGAASIALDSARNIYIAGSTFSTDFPLVNPIQNV